MTKRMTVKTFTATVSALVAAVVAALALLASAGCAKPDNTPPVPTEPPDLTPAEITLETLELPETYGFLDYLTGSLRTKVAKQYKAQLDAVAVKLGKRFGFNGLASFEFDYNDPRLKPYLIGGEVVLFAMVWNGLYERRVAPQDIEEDTVEHFFYYYDALNCRDLEESRQNKLYDNFVEDKTTEAHGKVHDFAAELRKRTKGA